MVFLTLNCLRFRGTYEVEGAVVRIAFDYLAYGQFRACNELRKKGFFLSPAGVRCIWQRHDLEIFEKRLKALDNRVAQNGLILTEAQAIVMERKKEKQEAYGEIETEHPGYLVAQDTYYIGTIKEVGRIYQETVIGTGFLPSWDSISYKFCVSKMCHEF